MKTISLCTPTRNRPEKVSAMVRGALALAASPGDVELLFYLDLDDTGSEPAIHEAAGSARWGGGVRIVRGERLRDQSYWNRLAELARGDVLFLAADDLAFRTRGWDDIVRAALADAPGGVGMAYGDDGDLGRRLATHPFVTRRWFEAAGFFVPPYFERCFVDLWIFELAILTGLFRYLPELAIEHLHVELDKALPDATYEEIRGRPFSHRRYAELIREREEQALRLLAAAGLDRALDTAELARRKIDARNGAGGKWFVWP